MSKNWSNWFFYGVHNPTLKDRKNSFKWSVICMFVCIILLVLTRPVDAGLNKADICGNLSLGVNDCDSFWNNLTYTPQWINDTDIIETNITIFVNYTEFDESQHSFLLQQLKFNQSLQLAEINASAERYIKDKELEIERVRASIEFDDNKYYQKDQIDEKFTNQFSSITRDMLRSSDLPDNTFVTATAFLSLVIGGFALFRTYIRKPVSRRTQQMMPVQPLQPVQQQPNQFQQQRVEPKVDSNEKPKEPF